MCVEVSCSKQEACADVTTGVDITYSTTTPGGDTKTGAATNIRVAIEKKRSDLDNHHNFGLCHMADKCSDPILSGLTALKSRDFHNASCSTSTVADE